MKRFLEIAQPGRYLSVYRGFLRIQSDSEELARVPLADLAAVIVCSHGVTFSQTLLVTLADANTRRRTTARSTEERGHLVFVLFFGAPQCRSGTC